MKKFKKATLSYAAAAGLLLGTYAGVAAYYLYDNQKVISEIEYDEDRLAITGDNQLCYRLGIGEHVIEVSRNDMLYHKIEEVEGYTIKEVEINGWRDNNKVVYVNTKPVYIVLDYNGLNLNNFGTVYDPQIFIRR